VHGRGHNLARECEKPRRRAGGCGRREEASPRCVRLAKVEVSPVLLGLSRTSERGGVQCV